MNHEGVGDTPRRPFLERHRKIILMTQGIIVPAGLAGIAWAAVRHGDSISPKGHIAFLIGAVATLHLSLLVFAHRLHQSLQTMDIRISMVRAMQIAMQSLFYFFFIPFSTGAELSRWAKIKAAAPNAPHLTVLTAVGFDRFMAALACLSISFVSLPFVTLRGVSSTDAPTLPVHPAVAIAVLLVILGLAAAVAVRRGWIRQVLVPIHSAGPRLIRGAMLVGGESILIQLLSITTLWLLARWLGIDLSFAALALGTSGGMLAQVIPISLAGAGPAELGSGLLFAACGATTDEAVMLTTSLYLCRLVGAVEGGILELPLWKARMRPSRMTGN